MFRVKGGFPEESELVLCTVTNVQHNSVFAKMEEYGKTGMIHISEVSPGRIRNIRDYVKEGKVIVCKILRVNKERGYIDMSLRRVSENQRRVKVNTIKQEQKAEKILEFVAKNLKKDTQELYKQIEPLVFSKFESLYSVFEESLDNEKIFGDLNFPKEIIKLLKETINQRIKPKIVEIEGAFSISSYDPRGLEIIKEGLKKAAAIDAEKVTIRYNGGGRYGVKITENDYKDAEKILEKVEKTTFDFFEKKNCEIKFKRAKS